LELPRSGILGLNSSSEHISLLRSEIVGYLNVGDLLLHQ
jgi:hypothetical protein